MSEFLYSALGFLLALAVLIAVHEFGHFWVARRVGVRVLRFSLGFGRPLYQREFGPDRTQFVVAAIPLGGYVKMLDEREGDVDPAEAHRAFNRKSLWARSAVVLAGPGANFLFAVLAYAVLNMTGVEGLSPVVGRVQPDSLAQAAGFRTGDRLLDVDGRAIRSWDEQALYLFNRALDGKSVAMGVEDPDGARRVLRLDFSGLARTDLEAGFLTRDVGLWPRLPPPLLGEPTPGGPADQAGLRAGDQVKSVDGEPVATPLDLVQLLRARPGRAVALQVERDGAELALTVHTLAETGEDGQVVGKMQAPIQMAPLPAQWKVRVQDGPVAALAGAVDTTWSMSALILKMFGRMVMLEASTKNISGPLTIARAAGQSAQIGFDQFLAFLAIVSVSLGVINLLPIPVLDGGHLLYHLGEAFYGRPLPERVMLWGQQIGILLILGLMSLAFYNDLVRFLQ